MANSTPPTIHELALACLQSGAWAPIENPRVIAQFCYTVAEAMKQEQERWDGTKGKAK